jgi:hypothetical protein
MDLNCIPVTPEAMDHLSACLSQEQPVLLTSLSCPGCRFPGSSGPVDVGAMYPRLEMLNPQGIRGNIANGLLKYKLPISLLILCQTFWRQLGSTRTAPFSLQASAPIHNCSPSRSVPAPDPSNWQVLAAPEHDDGKSRSQQERKRHHYSVGYLMP